MVIGRLREIKRDIIISIVFWLSFGRISFCHGGSSVGQTDRQTDVCVYVCVCVWRMWRTLYTRLLSVGVLIDLSIMER